MKAKLLTPSSPRCLIPWLKWIPRSQPWLPRNLKWRLREVFRTIFKSSNRNTMTCHGGHPTLWISSRKKAGILLLTSGIRQLKTRAETAIIMIPARGGATTRSIKGNLALRRLKYSNNRGRRRLTAASTWFSTGKAMKSSDRPSSRAMITWVPDMTRVSHLNSRLVRSLRATSRSKLTASSSSN